MAKPFISIGQGEALNLRIRIIQNGEPVLIDNIEKVEFTFGDCCAVKKYYPNDVEYDAETDKFIVSLTQEDTFSFPPDSFIFCAIRVKFIGGNVRKVKNPIVINVIRSQSREVL